MATVTVPTPKPAWIEVAADVLTVLIAGDIMYSTVFGQPPVVKFLHDWIAVLGTIATMWLVWKMARRNKAFS